MRFDSKRHHMKWKSKKIDENHFDELFRAKHTLCSRFLIFRCNFQSSNCLLDKSLSASNR